VSNTDSQFTSPRFTVVLEKSGARISMDGRGRWMDNVFIERLWRNLKYECIYLNAFETGSELRAGLTWWIGYYNARRPHSTLDGRTPDDTYWARHGEVGGPTTIRTELIQAAKLSNWRGPPQSGNSIRAVKPHETSRLFGVKSTGLTSPRLVRASSSVTNRHSSYQTVSDAMGEER
jgi:hypothetical protein